MKDFWNNRYQEKEWAYGKEPNVYFKQILDLIKPGSILLPADGEGRNSVYAAACGWSVNAADLSEVGKTKALALAGEKQVSINYKVGNLMDLDFPVSSFDAMALIYAHFPPDIRTAIHQKLISYLKPGGIVIFEAFSKDHLHLRAQNPQSGGPGNPAMLFSENEVSDLFSGFEILELAQVETELNEGQYHRGQSSVVRFWGKKL